MKEQKGNFTVGLEEILKKIEEKNNREIEAIKRETYKEVERIEKDAERDAKELLQKAKTEAKKKAEQIKEHMLQEARLHKAKEILKTKSEILNEVFKEAMKRLENLPKEKYLCWMEKLVLKACQPGDNELILSEEDRKRLNGEDFVRKLNQKVGPETSIRLSNEKRPIKSGFILKQKRKETNCSFDSLLEEKSDKLKVKIGQLLFK